LLFGKNREMNQQRNDAVDALMDMQAFAAPWPVDQLVRLVGTDLGAGPLTYPGRVPPVVAGLLSA
jgi:hypothetical protein